MDSFFDEILQTISNWNPQSRYFSKDCSQKTRNTKKSIAAIWQLRPVCDVGEIGLNEYVTKL